MLFLKLLLLFFFFMNFSYKKWGLNTYVSSEISSRALSEVKRMNMTINENEEEEDYGNEEEENKTVELENKY